MKFRKVKMEIHFLLVIGSGNLVSDNKNVKIYMKIEDFERMNELEIGYQFRYWILGKYQKWNGM